MAVTSFFPSFTLLLLAETEAETHLKKAASDLESAVSNCTTHSGLICFNTLVSAPCPAAQQTTIPQRED